ncbi:MAG: hypothetical protein DWQ05_21705 [Calditrichaeota bacterium]|nr:MAG: hypothetical protein DWQ05_21705 [Calditrichota bacterium]
MIVVLVPVFMGCNIFSGMNSGSDDPDALLEQGKAALQNGENAKALEYFDKAKQKDAENYEVLYFHSVATARVHEVDFTSFLETFQEVEQNYTPGSAKNALNQVFSTRNDTLFNLSLEKLQDLLQTFLVVNDNLRMVGAAIESGELTIDEFPYVEDVLLSRGLAAIVANMILLIDTDGVGPEFVLDENFILERVDEAYQLVFQGNQEEFPEFKAEIASRVQRQWPGIDAGVRSLYLYYTWTQCGALPAPENMPQIPGTLSPAFVCAAGSETSLAWQLFEIAFNGTSSLHALLQ